MKQTLTMSVNGREISFQLDLDPDFIADRTLMYFFENKQLPEPEVLHVMARVLREGDTAVDGGANIGFFSLVMAKLVGESGKVIAIEPGENNIAKITHNLAINNASNVGHQIQPLWCQRGVMPLFIYDDSGANSLKPYTASDFGKLVGTCSLDDLCASEPVRLLKLDIEGAEHAAILGGVEFFKKQCPPFVVMELNEEALARFDTNPTNIRNLMLDSFGYDMFMLSETGNFPTLVPFDVHIEFTKKNANVLFSTLSDVSEAWPTVRI